MWNKVLVDTFKYIQKNLFFNGALDVHIKDVHDTAISKYFHRHTGVSDTIAVASLKGDTAITVYDGTLFAVLDYLHIKDTIYESTFPQITAISGNTLTLDRPLDNAYSIGDDVSIVIIDMNEVGTLASPISFKFTPIVGETWHVVRIIFTMTHGTEGDLGLFGDISSLTNGVVLRVYNASANQYATLAAWKNNGEIKDDMYFLDFDLRTATFFGTGGTNGTTGKGDIKDGSGAVPKLNGTDGDYMELLIQDDLSSLNTFRLKGQGHLEQKEIIT